MMELSVDDVFRIHRLGERNLDGMDGSTFSGVSTDSRTLKRGEIFVALRGEHFDGNRFVTEAFSRGASLGVVESSSPYAREHGGWPLILVEDTMKALGQLASVYRRKFNIPVMAIAGSNGKTTTKEMTAAVLGTAFTVLKTEGNLNNRIGVPQTLFRLRKDHEVAVVEIGTNHPGEIGALCRILEPTHGLVTTIEREHLEFFGSVRKVAAEEGTLYRFLRGRRGTTALVNADDRLVTAKAKGMRKSVTYGFTAARTKVRGTLLGKDQRGCVRFRFAPRGAKRSVAVQLRIPGEHNAMNALAAAATGLAFGMPSTGIASALEKFMPVNERMQLMECSGVVILNDAYNANPDSTLAALRTLASMAAAGKKIAVLADMLELGSHSGELHASIGKEVGLLGLDFLLTYGNNARRIYEAATIESKFHYEQKNVLAEYLLELLSPGDIVLVKGSRGMRMEDVVTFIRDRLTSAENLSEGRGR